jgi:hypothetical protein
MFFTGGAKADYFELMLLIELNIPRDSVWLFTRGRCPFCQGDLEKAETWPKKFNCSKLRPENVSVILKSIGT